MTNNTLPNHFELNNLKLAITRKQLYVHISMPCPLKIPVRQLLNPFIEKWNSNSEFAPLYCPMEADCSSEELKTAFKQADKESELPDILVTSAYDILFSKDFRERYINTGYYDAFPIEYYTSDYPENIITASEKFKTFFLAFSSWGIVHDLAFKGKYPIPEKWTDVANPAFKDLFSLHGCHGHAGSMSMLLSLVKRDGDKAIERFAENVWKVRHFAELISEINSSQTGRTPFYILPYSAIANIPSKKKIRILTLSGGSITPMMCLVKQSALSDCKEVIHFITGNEFKNTLAKGAYFQPAVIEGFESFQFEDLQVLSEMYYENAELISKRFVGILKDKIK